MSEIIIHPNPELADIIPQYLENRRQDVLTLKQMLQQQDFQGIHFLGHRMKGSGGGYGFTEISKIGSQLEQAAQEKNIQAIAETITALENYLNQVKVIFP